VGRIVATLMLARSPKMASHHQFCWSVVALAGSGHAEVAAVAEMVVVKEVEKVAANSAVPAATPWPQRWTTVPRWGQVMLRPKQ